MTSPEYAPSPTAWVRDQVAAIEAAGDTAAVSLGGAAVVVLTMRGMRTGALRKVPLMRVEHAGSYAAIGSRGGAPDNPKWVSNLRAQPDLDLMDGRQTIPMRAREVSGAERAQWWARAVAVFPDYAEYAVRTEREFPVFVMEPRTTAD